MENSNLAIGALAWAIGIFALSNRASAEPVEGATPFSPLEKQEQDQKKQKETFLLILLFRRICRANLFGNQEAKHSLLNTPSPQRIQVILNTN